MMRLIILPLLLAVAWMLLTARIAVDSFILGYVLSTMVVVLLGRAQNESGRLSIARPDALVMYMVILFRQIIASDVMVMQRIISNDTSDSGIVKVPVNSNRESVAAFSAHAITSSPGSFIVDFEADNTVMLIHSIDVEEEAALLKQQEQRATIAERMLSDG